MQWHGPMRRWLTVTYRQNTELMVEAWHWNAAGTWSNAEQKEGYFTGSEELGASGTFYFHYKPTAGGRGGFLALDKDYRVVNYPPQYLAAQVITKEWVQPVDAPHGMFRATSDVTDDSGNVLVTAYALGRPDGQWSVMLINKDHDNDRAVSVSFADSKAKNAWHFAGTVDRIIFGPNEYQWHDEQGGRGHADPDGPASKSTVQGGGDVRYTLPKASVVVLRGHIAE